MKICTNITHRPDSNRKWAALFIGVFTLFLRSFATEIWSGEYWVMARNYWREQLQWFLHIIPLSGCRLLTCNPKCYLLMRQWIYLYIEELEGVSIIVTLMQEHHVADFCHTISNTCIIFHRMSSTWFHTDLTYLETPKLYISTENEVAILPKSLTAMSVTS